MQFYACVCISATIAQYNPMLEYVCPSRLCNYCTIQWPKCAPGDDYSPGLLPGLCGPYLMEEHNHKRFKSLLRSLRNAYNFSDALKTHLNVCRVCCPLNDSIAGCLEPVCQMAARAEVALVLTAIPHAE